MDHPPTPQTPGRILVIVAHADDIEFGAAGGVARWVQEGAQVTYCIVTDNGAGSNDPGVRRLDLVKRREDEQRAAAALVGVTDVRFLGYTDGELEPTLALRRDLARLIREIRPQRVVCQDPTTIFVENWYINHPDHRAAGEAAVYAVFPSAGTRPIFADLLNEGYEPHDVQELYMMLTDKADTYVDISAHIDLKIEALLCHQSQVGPDVGKMVLEWDAESGKKAGCAYAEEYRVMRFVETLGEQAVEAGKIQDAAQAQASQDR
jgi:LmbE family N-acetylglucosaminyl deacetylase